MNQSNQTAVSPKALIEALSTDCELHAKEARHKLDEVIERFESNDALAAIGAFEGTTEVVLYMDAVLKRLAAIVRRL